MNNVTVRANSSDCTIFSDKCVMIMNHPDTGSLHSYSNYYYNVNVIHVMIHNNLGDRNT